jgi:hypothetical protein
MSTSTATFEWVDAATPHAKLLHSARASTPKSLRNGSEDIQRAIERIERFQASVRAEAMPLVVAEMA